MTRARTLRLLRIAVSAVCGILCLLLIALWVRSYSWVDAVYFAHLHSLVSTQGKLCLDCGISRPAVAPEWSQHCGPLDTLSVLNYDEKVVVDINGVTAAWPSNWSRVYPFWTLTLLFGTLAVVPWMRCRFSLRTLLLATTLVAVMLGLVMTMR